MSDDRILPAPANDLASMNFEDADDNIVQPFQFESSNIRGRCIRLGSVLNDVLEPHAYPLPVAHMVGELMALTALLSSMLKYEGIFTLQIKGDGPVSLMVADMKTDGALRACATFDKERLERARAQISDLKTVESSQNYLAQYLGTGYLVFTVDQGDKAELYQGIVELKGASLTDCVLHYFTQSEQIETGIKMSAGMRAGKWRAGGIMLQALPEDDVHAMRSIDNAKEDDWRMAMTLLDTCTDEEFLSEDLHSNALLMRLFHEEGVRVFEPTSVRKECRCSVSKIEGILKALPEEDIAYLKEEGEAKMRCEFCSKEYTLPI